MRVGIVLALALAGCQPQPPDGFGVNLTVSAGGLSAEERAAIESLRVRVAVERYDKRLDVRGAIGSGEVRFHYVPAVTSGALVFAVEALSAGDALVATAESDAVTLVEGHAIPLVIALGASPPDLGNDLPPPDLGADLPPARRQPGDACTGNLQCESGFCVEHVCCQTACAGACVSCAVPGAEGTCSPVASGGAPAPGHPGCGPDLPATCQLDGKCDGKGACRLWPLNTICKDSICNAPANLFTAESTCDGKGACVTPAAASCAPFLCKDARICVQTCTQTPGQCVDGKVCTGGSCGLKEDGATCSGGTECKNGFCADGVCCDQACSETCKSCNQSASRGRCTLVPAGQDPRGSCAAGTGLDAACRPGGCSGTAAACAVAPAATPCRAAACSATTQTAVAAAFCNGSGTCNASAGTACAPYKCGTSACNTSCAGDGDCQSGSYCSSGSRCVAKGGAGAACSAASQCASNICADGVCCNAACGGACEACDVPGSVGTCSPVPAGLPRVGHPTCINQGQAPCGGSCNGAGRDCSYSSGQCGDAYCGCGNFPAHSDTCDYVPPFQCMTGVCQPSKPMTCPGNYGCNSLHTACLTTCNKSNPSTCAPNKVCVLKITGNFCE